MPLFHPRSPDRRRFGLPDPRGAGAAPRAAPAARRGGRPQRHGTHAAPANGKRDFKRVRDEQFPK